jgi:hypothetical protein
MVVGEMTVVKSPPWGSRDGSCQNRGLIVNPTRYILILVWYSHTNNLRLARGLQTRPKTATSHTVPAALLDEPVDFGWVWLCCLTALKGTAHSTGERVCLCRKRTRDLELHGKYVHECKLSRQWWHGVACVCVYGRHMPVVTIFDVQLFDA